jgi:Flp pilus assembly protein TadG
LIEFALIVPVMLTILLGTIDLGRAFVFGVTAQDGAREAARLAERAATDINVSDTAVLTRLIAASNPALIGCNPVLGTQPNCGGGIWTLSIDVTTPTGTSYTSIAAAKADSQFPGSKLTVTARGSVSLLAGFRTSWGMALYPIVVQGQASMVVL